jgi:ATP-dependent Lon protease
MSLREQPVLNSRAGTPFHFNDETERLTGAGITMSENGNIKEGAATGPHSNVPDDVLIILPIRNTVVFPGAVIPLTIGRRVSLAAAEEAAGSGRPIGLVMQRDPSVDEPGPDDLHSTGTIARVIRYFTARDGTQHVVCQGEERFRTLDYLKGLPFLAARFDKLPEQHADSTALEARLLILRERALEAIALLPQAMPELGAIVQGISDPGQLADLVAGYLDIKPQQKQEILETFDVQARLDRVLDLLSHQVEVLKLSRQVDEQTKDKLEGHQREFYLREQLRTIQKELGDSGDVGEFDALREAIDKAGMPEEAENQARKELKRLERMPEASGENAMVRTRQVLDADHFGLDKVKRRILEYLAVRKLNPEGRSPILCFVGPPGVGKTSLGQSIAKALGLKFQRAAWAVCTTRPRSAAIAAPTSGALPGNIDPGDAQGRHPQSGDHARRDRQARRRFPRRSHPALLEVLDPEQNRSSATTTSL